MSGRQGSADEEELKGDSATVRYRRHLEGKSSPAGFWLHTEDPLAALKMSPYENTPFFVFLTKNKGNIFKQGFALN